MPDRSPEHRRSDTDRRRSDGEPRRSAPDGTGSIGRFTETLREAGGSVHVVADGREAAEVVEGIVRRAGGEVAPQVGGDVARQPGGDPGEPGCGGRVLYAPSEILRSAGVVDGLRRRGILLDAVDEVDRPEDYGVGLTGVRWAVAETGSLIVGGCREPRGGWGVASVLPRVHVAVLRAADIHPDLEAAHAELVRRMAAGETEWVWISGPSSTADIAKTLVHGIHGPNQLHAVILTPGSEVAAAGHDGSTGTGSGRPG